MTNTSMGNVSDDIADLRAQIETLNARLQAESPRRERAKKVWRRPLALVGTAVLAVGMLAGVAGASGTTTNVAFIALSPAKIVLSNVTIASKKSTSPVVIGGTTTVPADATTVELTVTAKGTASGTIDFFPAMNTAGGSGQTLTYPGSNTAVTTTIQENIGQSGELTFYNAGLGSAVVTAKIIGYSTQVTAGDINGVGGTAGQMLTNDGSGGASWTTLGGSGSAGQVLTHDAAGGATWQTPGRAYSSTAGYTPLNGFTQIPIDSVSLPAGTYLVSSSFDGGATASDILVCYLEAPNGGVNQYQYASIASPYGSTFYGGGSTQELVSTSGGAIRVLCYHTGSGSAEITSETLTATNVGTATGSGVIN